MKGPMIILNPCAQSHPFDERRCPVGNAQDPLKIGRSVARLKPMTENAIFDCKVLSRNHAILWFSDGAFMIKDTKSSNGTFVNNERLGQSGEDSPPRQINTGDIIQFGVEIVENANKVSHGCILAMVRLLDENGEEIECQANTFESGNQSFVGSLITGQQLFQIQQFLKEALLREKYRDDKIAQLHSQLQSAELATDQVWKSFLSEDRLLARIIVLEGQLALKAKDDNAIRNEMHQMLADKAEYMEKTHNEINKAREERVEAELRLSDTERSMLTLEEEFQIMKQRYENLINYNATVTSALEEVRSENTKLVQELEAKAELLKSEPEDQPEDIILPQIKPEDDPEASLDHLLDLSMSGILITIKEEAEGDEKILSEAFLEPSSDELGKEELAIKKFVEELARVKEENAMLQATLINYQSEIATLRVEAATRQFGLDEPIDPTVSTALDESALQQRIPHLDNVILLSIIPFFSFIVLLVGYIYTWIARKIGSKRD